MPDRTDDHRLLDALHRTGALLSADAGLERIMQDVTDAATDLTGARFGAFFYNGDGPAGDVLKLFTVAGISPDLLGGVGHPRATPVFAPTSTHRQIPRSGDITADPRYGKMGGMPAGHFPVRSYLAVPVVSGNAVVGTLMVGHPDAGVFDATDEKVAAALAGQAAVAIQNARLFRAHRTLEAKLLEMNERLAVRVDERTAERDRMWRLATDCLAVFSHAGNTILAVNPAWTSVLGWREDELVGKPALDFVHDADRPGALAATAVLVENGTLPHFECRFLHKAGGRSGEWQAET